MDILHNEWCPCQLRLNGDCFEYARLKSAEEFVEALCKVGFGFLHRRSIIKNADPEEDVKE